MTRLYEIAVGSIPGRRHLGKGGLLVGRNNQDAYAFRQGAEGTVAVVCDGCSAGARSEIGAHIGARILCAAAWETFVERKKWSAEQGGAQVALEVVRRRCLGRLALLGRILGGEPSGVLEELLCFTVLLSVITEERALVAALGDGLVVVNGEQRILGPFPGNAPPYLAYGLLGGAPGELRERDLRFRTIQDSDAAEVRHILLGTDGVEDWIRQEASPLPGRAEVLGPLSQLWTDDRYFTNPDALRRRLALANSEPVRREAGSGRLLASRGLLDDDTTVLVLRRRETDAPAAEGRGP